MMDKVTRHAFRFFADNAGGIVGECAIGALRLARAEQKLQAAILEDRARIAWEHDEAPDTSWMDAKQLSDFHEGRTELLCCLLKTRCERGSFHVVASLGGIHILSGDRNYPRVIEAELALEAEEEL